MFKRRNPRTYVQLATEMVYPRGGWKRATQYVIHRMRRLPDPPSRIGRGFACGIFISFTPFFGFHFLGAALCAWIIRGNILAALLGTFIGNAVTTPLMAAASLTTGRWLLGTQGTISFKTLPGEFARAGAELYHNFLSMFTTREMHWAHLHGFYEQIFLPYAVGSIIPGVIAGVIAHYMTVPLIKAYHRRREKQMAERIAAIRAIKAAAEAAGDGSSVSGAAPGSPA